MNETFFQSRNEDEILGQNVRMIRRMTRIRYYTDMPFNRFVFI